MKLRQPVFLGLRDDKKPTEVRIPKPQKCEQSNKAGESRHLRQRTSGEYFPSRQSVLA